jgi:hypothetical protein
MLCDVVSLPEGLPDSPERMIEFSDLYESLHAVIAYHVDPELKRPWLRNEAYRILRSPTKLPYVYHKWRLRMPLIFSLTIRQICTRRLGLQQVNTSNLHICDTEDAAMLTLRDLRLVDEVKEFQSMVLDRRNQTFASDALVVYELSVRPRRVGLTDRLTKLKSNSAAAPALAAIWAMMQGFTVAVRGCDWDIAEIRQLAENALRHGCLAGSVSLRSQEDRQTLILEGAIEGKLTFDIEKPPRGLVGPSNLFVRCRDQAASTRRADIMDAFLEKCVSYMQSLLDSGALVEPQPLSADSPQYELLFDDYDHHDARGSEAPS